MSYDPFLFNPNDVQVRYDATRIDKIKAELKHKESSKSIQTQSEMSFQNLLTQQLKERDSNIASSQINRNMSREQILEHIGTNKERQKLYEAAREFESFFVEKMFREMKKNVPKNELFHGGMAENIFDDMLLTERVKGMSNSTEFGLAEMMYKQLQNI